jgi:hypothetical protein
MPLAKHNNMVKAIPPDRSDEPLHIRSAMVTEPRSADLVCPSLEDGGQRRRHRRNPGRE